MSREWMIQCAVLYLPVIVTAVLLAIVRDESRNPAALLMSLTWQAALVPVLDAACQQLGCWQYQANPWMALRMPLAIHLGWMIWWGAALPLMLECFAMWLPRKSSFLVVVAIAVGLDIVLMPLLNPVLVLTPRWLLGELGLCLATLLPGLWLYQLTRDARLPLVRGLMIALAFALLVLWVLPVSTLETLPALSMRRWVIFLLGLLPVIAIGVWAVWLFGVEGQGTPIPFDPPRNMVTSGIYRWLANPMQTSIILAMLWVAWFLGHKGLAIAAVSTWVYSVGIARWSENIDLTQRFGEAWLDYRRKTPNWWPRRIRSHSQKPTDSK